MKIRVTLKDPDGFTESVSGEIRDSVKAIEGLDESEREDLIETRTEKVWEQLEAWVKYQEYVTIEFDTDTGTAIVVER